MTDPTAPHTPGNLFATGEQYCLHGTAMLPELLLLLFLDLVIGIVFGFVHRGKEDYTGLLRNGVIAGLVMGILFVLAEQYLLPGGAGLGRGFSGVLAIFFEIVLFLLIFVAGTFIGDRIEGLRK